LREPLPGEGKERKRDEEKRMEGQKWKETSQIIFAMAFPHFPNQNLK